jgi:hypothetical protein
MTLKQLAQSLSKYNYSWKVKVKFHSEDPEELKSPVPLALDLEIEDILIDAANKTIFLYCKGPSVK